MMPDWALFVIGAPVLITAVIFLAKMLMKLVHAATAAERALPVMMDLTDTFHGDADIFLVIRAMAKQFQTDSGSSLRDAINRLETNTTSLQVSSESIRQLARDDREQVVRLMALLDKVETAVAGNTLRLNDAATAAEGVAVDLEASHARAEASDQTHPGQAADAAMVRPDESHPPPAP